MNRRDLRCLERLEIPTRQEYERAFRRARLRVERHLGAALTDEAAEGGAEPMRAANPGTRLSM